MRSKGDSNFICRDSSKRGRGERIVIFWEDGKEFVYWRKVSFSLVREDEEDDVWRGDWGYEEFIENILWFLENIIISFRELEKGMRRIYI